MSFRALFLSLLAGFAAVTSAHAQEWGQEPPCDIGLPPGAMSFYLAHGPSGSCGPGCSDWIAAEGSIQWDTFKRLIAFLEHHPNRKLPVVINIAPASNLFVATTLGRIFRERGLDTTVGSIEIPECARKTHEECLALKRAERPVRATVNVEGVRCDLACVLMLAGGVGRYMPPQAKVFVGWRMMKGSMCRSLSEERREALGLSFDERLRVYLRQMGIATEFADLLEENSRLLRTIDLTPQDWRRFKLVNSSTL